MTIYVSQRLKIVDRTWRQANSPRLHLYNYLVAFNRPKKSLKAESSLFNLIRHKTVD
uniref:Uncharacterized protein n=1 Tax=Acinetobacter baumannii TaxID=470 RepID=A0A140A0Q3_ACIBA|nr:hypothetical protein [Acinetobacter baumannii]